MLKEELFQCIVNRYRAKKASPWKRYPSYVTFSGPETGRWFALCMQVDRKKLNLEGEGAIDVLNLKAEPEFVMLMAGRAGILPAYHMNKKHWITVLLDGSVPEERLKQLIDQSYRLVTDTPARRIYEAVRRIPKGKVATYAQIAAMAGNPKMSRAVGNALHHNPDEQNIPCFRIVNAAGKLSGSFAFGGPDEQARRLRADGIEVIDGKVDLEKYQYRGEDDSGRS